MLYGYPIAATQQNWLHDCLGQIIRMIHTLADVGDPYPNWPEIVPKEYQGNLSSRYGLRDRLRKYNDVLRSLTSIDRDNVLVALEDENKIPELLSGSCECATIDELPVPIQEPISELFGFAFEMLTDLKIRDEHYGQIYNATHDHVCPFCGLENFDAPGAPRESLDHYLLKSKYPFAAVNLRNLVPMGHKCNSGYKLATNILRGITGNRRVAFYPYGHAGVSVSLDRSEPFGGLTENIPKWNIEFSLATKEVDTWDDVFHIRERYGRDHLDPSFRGWIELFAKVAHRDCVAPDSDDGVIATLRRLEELYADNGLQDRAFLKTAVFRMLRIHCEAGNRRLLDQLRNMIRYAVPARKADFYSSNVGESEINNQAASRSC